MLAIAFLVPIVVALMLNSAMVRSLRLAAKRQVQVRSFTRGAMSMMPEGPEVRSLTDSLRHNLCSTPHALSGAQLLSGRYVKSDPPQGWDVLNQHVLGQDKEDEFVVENIASKGKFIYMEFTKQKVAFWSTLGLSGGWTFSKCRSKHNRLSLQFTNLETKEPVSLFFYDMRNFGTFKVSSDLEELQNKLNSLGLDWLCEQGDKPTKQQFLDLGLKAGKYKRPLCVFMMDQKKTAGIGNYVLSEALYRAGLHPFCGTQDLFEQDWFDLYECISAVLDESYATQRPDMSSPSRGGISAPSRTKYNGEGGTFSFRVYSKKVDPYGQQVVHMTGTHKRTIWFVPSLQEKFKPVDFEL